MNSHPLKFIRDNWLIISFIVGVIITFANFQNADGRAQERIAELEESQRTTNTLQQQIQVQLSAIQNDILWIRKAISK